MRPCLGSSAVQVGRGSGKPIGVQVGLSYPLKGDSAVLDMLEKDGKRWTRSGLFSCIGRDPSWRVHP